MNDYLRVAIYLLVFLIADSIATVHGQQLIIL